MGTLSFYSSASNKLDDNGFPPTIETEGGQEELEPFLSFINQLIDAENLIVLAGSGTSLTFNKQGHKKIAPGMSDLWDSCENLDTDLFAAILDIVKYEPIAGCWPDGTPKKDIELLLSLCDSYLSLQNLGSEQQKNIEIFLTRAKNEILNETDFVDRVGSDDWDSHNKFMSALGRRSPKQKRLKIFTTNYDLAFEVAASNTGMIVIDGFEFSKPYRFNPAWFNYDIVNRSQASEKGGAYLPNIVHLYKIHGSVDWVRTPQGVLKKDSTNPTSGEPVFIYPSSTKYQNSYDSPSYGDFWCTGR